MGITVNHFIVKFRVWLDDLHLFRIFIVVFLGIPLSLFDIKIDPIYQHLVGAKHRTKYDILVHTFQDEMQHIWYQTGSKHLKKMKQLGQEDVSTGTNSTSKKVVHRSIVSNPFTRVGVKKTSVLILFWRMKCNNKFTDVFLTKFFWPHPSILLLRYYLFESWRQY